MSLFAELQRRKAFNVAADDRHQYLHPLDSMDTMDANLFSSRCQHG
jgi:hypothetical protein